MSFFHFQMPENWTGIRDIDARVEYDPKDQEE